jgi:hypothetical protein
MKPTVFGLLDFTADCHQAPLDQWTRVTMGLKGSSPNFQRSMSNTVLAGRVYQICELYIDDVLPTQCAQGLRETARVQYRSKPCENKARTIFYVAEVERM